ncbi:hypothetical protein [Mycolicibacterium sp. 624]|uniref:hypothetical protein n=1 Tax=Mycolicibacterium sp. 624 TaxID=3156314 RepID=UPI003399E813
MNDARAAWQPPDPVLSSSMREQPVAGWHTSVVDLGLPEANHSRIVVSNEPTGPRAWVKNVGESVYMLATSPAPTGQQWWLVGLNVRDGKRLFDAIPLGVTVQPPQCFLNGPNHILCLDEFPSRAAWVIDGRSGVVSHTGPTDLRLGSATLSVKQVGIYAVAETDGQGVYGIGPRAETTWFVPGDGRAQTAPPDNSRPVPQSLVAQGDANPRKWATTIFSVSDGKVIKPAVEEGASLADTAVYAGGFAAEILGPDGTRSGISFFDETGQRVGDQGVDGALSDDSIDLPVISSGDDSPLTVYSPQGRKLIEVPHGAISRVGTALLVNDTKSQSFPMWQQYDLKTGDEGSACDFPMQNYIGTDGSIFVFEVTNHNAGLLATARDRISCEKVWSIPSKPDSLARIWRINSTLIQLSDDGMELNSLVAR